MKVKVSLSNEKVFSKPKKGFEYGILKRNAVWQEIEIVSLAKAVGCEYYAFVPGHLENGISASNCTEMQLFALDFDNDKNKAYVSYNDIKKRCIENGLSIAFAYHTLSSSDNKEKFRIVFVTENSTKDTFMITFILSALFSIFPEADGHCNNLDRLFMPGKDLIEVNDGACLNMVHLLSSLYYALDKNNNYPKNLKDFGKELKIAILDKAFMAGTIDSLNDYKMAYLNHEINGNFDSIIIHTITGSIFPSFFVGEEKNEHQIQTRVLKKQKRIKSIDNMEDSSCKLLLSFFNEYDLPHDCKFAILSNLLWVQGGKKRFLDIVEKIDGLQKRSKWDKDAKYINCICRCKKSFCPYFDDCDSAGTILNTIIHSRKVKVDAKEYVSCEEAEDLLKNNIIKAMNHPFNNYLHLIPAQTALGKTHTYVDLVAENIKMKFVIAVPTIELRREIYNRLFLKVSKDDIFNTPSIMDSKFLPNNIKDKILKYHQCGLHNMTKGCVKEFYDLICDNPDMCAVESEALAFLEDLTEAHEKRIILTTHARLLTMSPDLLTDRIVIVDEDILYTQIFSSVCKVSESSLLSLLNSDCNFQNYKNMAKEMINSKEGEYVKVPFNDESLKLTDKDLELIGSNYDDNLGDITSASSYVKINEDGTNYIHYFMAHKLPSARYIILSATLNENLYSMYFNKDFQVISYPYKEAKNKGEIEQFTYHSLGRSDLKKKEDEVASFLFENNLQNNIITFNQNSKWQWNKLLGNHNPPLHFGNCTGIDRFHGLNLTVVGTPFKVEQAYKLVACYMGEDVNTDIDKKPHLRRVKYKGRSFLITTYHNPLLQTLMLHSLESELEQAVGRARVLRYDCKVTVLSAFPISQANISIKNYLTDNQNEIDAVEKKEPRMPSMHPGQSN